MQRRIQDFERGFVTPFSNSPFPIFPSPLPSLLCPFSPSPFQPFTSFPLPSIQSLSLPGGPSPFVQLGGLGSAVSSPAGSRPEPRPQKQFWHIWSPVNVPGGRHLGHSCVVQNAYGSLCIMRSLAPVTDTKFDLRKL